MGGECYSAAVPLFMERKTLWKTVSRYGGSGLFMLYNAQTPTGI